VGWCAAGVLCLGLLFWDLGQGTRADDGRMHVRYWHIAGADTGELSAVRTFQNKQDRSIVEVTAIPWQEHEKKTLTAVLSGNPPDVISQFAPVVQWASRMALRPLDDLIADSQLDTSVFFPALMEEMRCQGRTFAVPMFTASFAFFYNKDHVRQAGFDPDVPPRTWDEVAASASRLDAYDSEGRLIRAGFLPSFGPAHVVVLGNAGVAQLMAWQLGANYLGDDDRSVHLVTPPVIQAMTWVRDHYRNYDLDQVQAFIGGLLTTARPMAGLQFQLGSLEEGTFQLKVGFLFCQ
jgi:multiple sugar transport system substrate-binding protein